MVLTPEGQWTFRRVVRIISLFLFVLNAVAESVVTLSGKSSSVIGQLVKALLATDSRPCRKLTVSRLVQLSKAEVPMAFRPEPKLTVASRSQQLKTAEPSVVTLSGNTTAMSRSQS